MSCCSITTPAAGEADAEHVLPDWAQEFVEARRSPVCGKAPSCTYHPARVCATMFVSHNVDTSLPTKHGLLVDSAACSCMRSIGAGSKVVMGQ